MSDAARYLPLHLAQWWPYLKQAGVKWRVDPLLLAAVMDRESRGGEALTPKGPAGCGDFAPRGNRVPEDGLGWGRGLMQIDFAGHPDFCKWVLPNGTPAWQVPEWNVDKGAQLLSEALTAFQGDEYLACCAYNAGVRHVRNVLAALPLGSPEEVEHVAADKVTTGGSYGADVLRRRARFTHQGDENA